MFYPKNVPNWERMIRVVAGLALIVFPLINQTLGAVGAVIFIVAGLSAMVTGFVGWCPACAMVGRKIKQVQPKQGA